MAARQRRLDLVSEIRRYRSGGRAAVTATSPKVTSTPRVRVPCDCHTHAASASAGSARCRGAKLWHPRYSHYAALANASTAVV
ncbi:MAG: hypothetical protein JWR32_3896 [Mycobacterium sp.]|jgi:hypothetical protein|nr:hypothetical protein [Mycobacterium sp.]